MSNQMISHKIRQSITENICDVKYILHHEHVKTLDFSW